MATARDLNFDSESFSKYTTQEYYLSRGASGIVYGPIQWNGMQLAIKQVMFANGRVTDEFKKKIEVKKDIWTSLEHKHLMKIHSVDLNQLPKVMYIVMEFLAGGSLHETLRSCGSGNKLPVSVVTDWSKQIAEGMFYLHQINVVHRDVKPSNILLTEPFDIQNPHVKRTLKITDFDEVKEHHQTTTMSVVGTCAYMAPEVLVNQRFSKASDVWSFGVVVWEMLSGDIPYSGLESAAIICKSAKGELNNLPIQQSFPEDFKLILKRCWKSTSKKRLSFQEIVCVLQRIAEEKDVTEMLKYKGNMLQKYFRDNLQETSTQFENFAVVVGFGDDVYTTNDVVKINLRRPNEISKLEQMHTTILEVELFAAIYCNTLYLTGVGTFRDEIWKYNQTYGWKKCASSGVTFRRRYSAAFICEVLYICGGYLGHNGAVLDSVEAFNAVSKKCKIVGKLVHCVQNSGNCVPFKDSLYIFGGSDKDKNPFNHVQVYNTKENTCSVLSCGMPRPCMLMRSVLWETSVVLLGCYTCFIFNIETETWQERNQFKSDAYHFGLVLENEKLFVIGGGRFVKDQNGEGEWKCRDDVRYVPLQNILQNKPIEWKIHGTLPKPCLVYCCASMRFVV